MNVHVPREPDPNDPLIDEERARGAGDPERDLPDREPYPAEHAHQGTTEEFPPPSTDWLT